MTPFTKLYVGAVIGSGAVLLASAPREYPQLALTLTFVAAMLVVSLFKLRLPLGRGHSTMSMAYVVDFTVMLTAGVDLAMTIAAVGTLVQCTVNVRRAQPWYRTAFSVSAVVLAVRAAGWLWLALGGSVGEPGTAPAVLPLVGAAALYFAVNTWLIAGAIALSNGTSPYHCWQQHFLRTAPGYLVAGAGVAGLAVAMTLDVYLLLAWAAVLVTVGHFAYVLWFRRVSERSPAAA